MANYFRGWYYRCQSDDQTIAIIPSIHRTKKHDDCVIQLITDSASHHVIYPYCSYHKNGDTIQIGQSRFGQKEILLDIQTPEMRVTGTLRFHDFTPIGYDIMGPFRYVPFMQCRHSVFSMHHIVNGDININGICYPFHNAIGYMEGDRGRSFPKKYVWTQCSFADGAIMLSVADIPFCGFSFTGIIGIVLLNGKMHRLATYLGAKLIQATKEEILVRQGTYTLTVKPKSYCGHPLRAPVSGAMTRTIHEHPSCQMFYRFEKNGIALLERNAHNAAFEFEL